MMLAEFWPKYNKPIVTSISTDCGYGRGASILCRDRFLQKRTRIRIAKPVIAVKMATVPDKAPART